MSGVVTTRAVVLAMKLVPTVSNAELTLVDILANPVIVVLPADRVVAIVAAPEVSIVLADRTNLPIEFPRSIVLEVGTRAVVLANNPVVVKLVALMVPV